MKRREFFKVLLASLGALAVASRVKPAESLDDEMARWDAASERALQTVVAPTVYAGGSTLTTANTTGVSGYLYITNGVSTFIPIDALAGDETPDQFYAWLNSVDPHPTT